MNLNNMVIVTTFLSNVDVTKLLEDNKDDFLIDFAHTKVFIDSYYDCLTIIDIELAIAMNKTSKFPQSLLKGKINIDKYEDGDIVLKPLGVVFLGKNNNQIMTKFFIKVADVERYMNVQCTSLLVQINNCKKSSGEDNAEIRKTILW